jgi:hypothetical protein
MLVLVVAPDQFVFVEVHFAPPIPRIEEGEQAVGGQPPKSFSVSAQSLSNGGGATTLTSLKN